MAYKAEKLRFGLIGCGTQGRFLSEALRLTGKADLVACADVNSSAAQQAIRQCGYQRAFDDATQMFESADLDAVIVATQHQQLHAQTMAAIRAGKHVLVEKPIALTAAEGEQIVSAASQQGVVVMPGYSLRFLPERQFMRELLDRGAVGELRHVQVGQMIPPQNGWLDQPSTGGGPLYYIGSHIIDQVLWVVEQSPQAVQAQVRRPDPQRTERDVTALLDFANGVSATVTVSQDFNGRYGWIDLIGTDGRIRCEWEKPQVYVESRVISAYQHPTWVEVPEDYSIPAVPADAQTTLAGWRYIRGWVAELDAFVEAIRRGQAPPVTAEQAVEVLRVIDAIFESEDRDRPHPADSYAQPVEALA